VLGHRLVQQRAFGVARVVELGFGFGCRGHRYCVNTQYFAGFSSVGLRNKNGPEGPFVLSVRDDSLTRTKPCLTNARPVVCNHGSLPAWVTQKVSCAGSTSP
jgi:hypothetical protein